MVTTVENIVKVPLIPASRISVHNATGAALAAGNAVRATGSETNGIPNVEKTDALSEVFLGVLYEPIEDGEDGLCVVGPEIVEVVVNADVTEGGFAGLSTEPGRFEDLDLSFGAAGTDKVITLAGIFINGAGTESAGDKVRMLILHGVYAQAGG